MSSKIKDKSFSLFGVLAATLGLAVLGVLIIDVFFDAKSVLGWHFLISPASRNPKIAGILFALLGTLYVTVIVMIFAFPLGIGAAIYIEEYAKKNWLTNFIEINIYNLAGIPSIVYGIVSLGIFGYLFALKGSALLGGLTLGLLVLPIIIISAREALRSVPVSFREASYALGATKWETTWRVVLPAAFPGILTGTIFAIARAMGEAAPLIVVGAATYITSFSLNPTDSFTVLPIQIYNWVSYPQPEFHHLAAGGIIVLLVLIGSVNSLAIFLRIYFRKKIKW